MLEKVRMAHSLELRACVGVCQLWIRRIGFVRTGEVLGPRDGDHVVHTAPALRVEEEVPSVFVVNMQPFRSMAQP